MRLTVACRRLDLSRVQLGDSICVQGCCLTVTERMGQAFAADVSRETLSLTTLGDLVAGSPVNLEREIRSAVISCRDTWTASRESWPRARKLVPCA